MRAERGGEDDTGEVGDRLPIRNPCSSCAARGKVARASRRAPILPNFVAFALARMVEPRRASHAALPALALTSTAGWVVVARVASGARSSALAIWRTSARNNGWCTHFFAPNLCRISEPF